jgi:putative hydrolase of the HAD superfamily
MIKAIISDFSGVILMPADSNYTGGLNTLNKKLLAEGDYNFWQYFKLNEELLEYYRSLRNSLKVYVFTTGYIQEHPTLSPRLKGTFDEIFSCEGLGLNEKDREAYEAIVDKVGLKSEEIIYIDDKQENIDTASSLGIGAILYTSNEQAIADIKDLIKS